MTRKVTSIFQRQQPETSAPAHGPLFKLLKQQSIEVLHTQLKAMFDCADDTLFDWAQRAAGEEQHRCMSLMRLLRVEKTAVVDGFFKNFVDRFDQPRSTRKANISIHDSELSMQPTDALEESIAISNMTARAEGMFRDELFELDRRLDWAIDHCNERIELHPMEPQSISEVFLEASRVIEMDIESRLVVLKLFERTVIIQLGDLYKRLLSTLDENGVQPSAVVRPKDVPDDEPPLEQSDSYRPTSQISNMLSALGAMAGGLKNFGFSKSSNAGAAPQDTGFAPQAGAETNSFTAPAGGPAPWPQAPGAGGMPGTPPATGYYGDNFTGNPSGVNGGAPSAGGAPGWAPPSGAAGMPGMPPAGNYAGNYGGNFGAYSGTRPPNAPPIGAFGRPLPQGYAAYAGYTDANLASELAERISAWMQKPKANAEQEPIAQRTELIGRMFDNFSSDPSLPETVKPILETLRFPVLKAALADPSFLNNAEHPLRVLLRDLATTAASSARTSKHDPTASLSALSQAMAPLLTPDAPVVRANIDQPEPVTEEAIQSFLGHMDEDAATRRKVIVQRGIQRVDQELKQVVESRELLATAELLIDRALRPLLGLTLLRHSIVSPIWKNSLEMAKRVIHSVDLAHATAFSHRDREVVRDDFDDALVMERIPQERHDEAISTLRALHDEIEAYLEKRAPAPKKAATKIEPPAVKPLRDYLSLGAWFRVYNHKDSEIRWMRLLEHEHDLDYILFGGFDADNRMTVSIKDFEADLINGRSEPLDPAPDFEAALAAQRRSVSNIAEDAIATAKARLGDLQA